MSELFYLLWLADAVGSLQSLGLVVFPALLVCFFITGMLDFDSYDDVKRTPILFQKTKWIFVALVGIAVLPSPTTIKALVAVKVGDYAVHSELGEKAIKTLETVLDRVVEGKKD